MLRESQVTCWVVSDGKAGMENQCVGLAEVMGLKPIVKRVRLRTPWRQLTPYIRLGHRFAYSTQGDKITAPWPDLLIASGRASIPACLMARAGGSKTVYIQNPVLHPSYFDLVIAPEHDRLSGDHVLSTKGGLHKITPELLQSEAAKFRDMFATLPHPLVAVIIGGPNAVYRLTPDEMHKITQQLIDLTKQAGCGLMVTASRRTGEENLAILRDGLRGTPAILWDGQGANPYHGMLGLADAILVTADSVNMVTEACATGKPVHVIPLQGGSDKFRRFHAAMAATGATRPFTGQLEQWSYPPINDMPRAAERVWEILREKP